MGLSAGGLYARGLLGGDILYELVQQETFALPYQAHPFEYFVWPRGRDSQAVSQKAL